ncbi:MAG: IPT/TIG domain-containing protein, partial [Kangiellaceae bacterium]|nr:IPT/TIG domain-containing protein [Kangiellaceae bacterium]
ILSHSPYNDERDVNTDQSLIKVELSAVLPPQTQLENYFEVLEGDPQIGELVTSNFEINFATRNSLPHYRIIELTANTEFDFKAATEYFVKVKRGLNPLTGYALKNDYVFGFTTSAVEGGLIPEFFSVTPDQGDINGGTEIVVRGTNFGETPALELGNQKLHVTRVEEATAEDPYQKIYATTVPNYAGPASVKVTNDQGLSDTALGVFTYIDDLRLSFVTPGVVRVNQNGEGEKVEIIGYGFNTEVELSVYQSGKPETAVSFTADEKLDGSRPLSLYSSERMTLLVPDFGESYRGFVDFEVTDPRGRKAVLPRALFYGLLRTGGAVETEAPLSKIKIEEVNSGKDTYEKDHSKLPPGAIVDFAVDPQSNLVYVLGKGILSSFNQPENMVEFDQAKTLTPAGWITLVGYDLENLDQADPKRGVGYGNLPFDLVPQKLYLSDQKLYVAAKGHHYPFINTDYEDQSLLLVFDKEDRDPDSQGSDDRSMKNAVPMPFNHPIKFMKGVGNLLVLANEYDGIAIVDIGNAESPSVIKTINTATVNGTDWSIRLHDLEVQNDRLVAVINTTPADARKEVFSRVEFDLTKPNLPQLSGHASTNETDVIGSTRLAQIEEGVLEIIDNTNSSYPRNLGSYDSNGFVVAPKLNGENSPVVGLDSSDSVVAMHHSYAFKDECQNYLPFYDVSDPRLIQLIDVVRIRACHGESMGNSTPPGAGEEYDLLQDNFH